MKYIVLFQHSCDACSKVAKMVRDTSIDGLEARALEDPQVSELLSNASLQVPDRPSLLIISNDGLQVISGWAMRRRLARVVGWRRSGTIVGLLTAEWRARLTRSAESHAPSRRGVIGGALAGLAGWALMSGSAAASPQPGERKPEMTLADPAEVRAVMATASVQRAIRTWGPVEDKVYKVSDGRRLTFMLTHPRDGILTFAANSPGAPQGGKPAAVSLGETPTAEHGVRYYSVGGSPLADLTVSSGRVKVSPVPSGAVAPGRTAQVEPDYTAKQIACFVACTGRRAGSGCISECLTCLTGVILHHPNPIDCAECTTCAGRYGTECVAECGL